ncbi:MULTISPECIES: thiolase family protein [Micrococcales]|jgi:acetyl-CoA acetyltransferase family protein|uniref:thiolase family protein n=1 Tax=Micrococcales TaxID=85006 RepID=UPI0009AE35E3|nr:MULTISPECIES: thiolase family protein [Micrococcales]MBT9607704.1 thiolase family protein [Microbacterium sp.]MCO7204591.1 thiolase family protein [Microbacterium sp. CnD16-F]MDH5134966.1 thiolase family protein [Microbacterium sp. RD10]MDH5138537.1 thiolase family protein [Microbacterium sp. RD11]MDH5146838.1 thiolase family protein [Microbacterium sp. RD12]|tara:strand:+ start:4044 stop:5213 length:1170 start_codon:yes stop_codon:yes gene_type:complete
MTSTFIYDAVRTPFGRAAGALSGIRPDDLAAVVMKAAVERTGVDPARIEDVIFGDANQAGEDNRNVARFGALLAGFPSSVTGVTVNRLCASSVEAVIQGSRAIESGDAELILAGGVESMSRAPFVLEKSPKPWPAVGNQTLWNTSIGWRMVNRALPKHWTISNGESAEKIAQEWGITREAQDAFSVRSHELAAKAWAEGRYDAEIVQVPGAEMARDEGIRDGSTVEKLAGLKALFAADGTVTAGNSSSINDGASAVLLGAEDALDAEPLARITGRAAHGVDPDIFPIAPIEAANKALARAGRTWADVDLVELNEAFASQSLACLKGWPDFDPEKLNIHGGAIAIGHPLGASGGRIIGHAAHELKRRGGGVAVAAICIGVGQGLAVVLER